MGRQPQSRSQLSTTTSANPGSQNGPTGNYCDGSSDYDRDGGPSSAPPGHAASPSAACCSTCPAACCSACSACSACAATSPDLCGTADVCGTNAARSGSADICGTADVCRRLGKLHLLRA